MLSDLRLTLRMLAKSPGFVAVAVTTLALGLGVNTAMFSIVNAVLFRSLPYPQTEQLQYVQLAHPERGNTRIGFSWLDYVDVREAQTSYAHLVAYRNGTVNVSGDEAAPERFSGTWLAGADPGRLLGVSVALGRWWHPEEDTPGAPPVAVISHRVWQTRYGADPAILGQSLRINGEAVTVIGVAPALFDYPGQCDVWQPQRVALSNERRDNRYLAVAGLLRPGVRPADAGGEIERLVERLGGEHPETNGGYRADVMPFRETFLGNQTRPILGICAAAVTGVLLIACVNVANLLLARGGVRAREIAVRAALGAGRGQVVRLLMMESLVLATFGAAFGLPLGWVLLRWFDHGIRSTSDNPPGWLTWTMDGSVLIYTLGAVVLTCLAAGLVPALRMARPNLTEVLKDGTRGSTGSRLGYFTRALVVTEVALSCVLLFASGLMIRTVVAANQIDLGYQIDGVMSGRVGVPESGYPQPEQRTDFFRRLEEAVRRRPEVAGVGFNSRLPTSTASQPVTVETGTATARPRAGVSVVTPGWLEAIAVAPRQGRGFDERDGPNVDPVAIVNTRMAEAFWPGQDPLGRRFKLGDEKTSLDQPWITVVGVIPSIYQGDFEEDVGPQIYRPMAQAPERFMSIFVRGRSPDAAALAGLIREEVRALDPDLPVYWLRPLREPVEEARFFKKLFATMFSLFGGIALAMAAVGLYGVMAYSVAQRTQEIGVRVALGAQPRMVVGLILRQGGWQLGVGLVVGLPLAYLSSRALAFLLYGVQPGDPLTLAATIAVLALAGLLACLIPAFRALRISPIEALRSS